MPDEGMKNKVKQLITDLEKLQEALQRFTNYDESKPYTDFDREKAFIYIMKYNKYIIELLELIESNPKWLAIVEMGLNVLIGEKDSIQNIYLHINGIIHLIDSFRDSMTPTFLDAAIYLLSGLTFTTTLLMSIICAAFPPIVIAILSVTAILTLSSGIHIYILTGAYEKFVVDNKDLFEHTKKSREFDQWYVQKYVPVFFQKHAEKQSYFEEVMTLNQPTSQ